MEVKTIAEAAYSLALKSIINDDPDALALLIQYATAGMVAAKLKALPPTWNELLKVANTNLEGNLESITLYQD